MDNNSPIYFDEINAVIVRKDLIYNIWLILLAAVTAVMGISACHTMFYTPEYTSSAAFVVSARGTGSTASTYSTLTTANEMAEVFREVFQSDVMKRTVRQYAETNLDDVSISARVIPKTNLIQVEVTGKEPEETYQVIRAVMDYYPNVSEYLFGNAVLEILKSPTVPFQPSNKLEVVKYEIMGGLAAAVLMTGIVMIFSILRSTVKTERGAKRRLKGHQLGLIGHEDKRRLMGRQGKKKKQSILITNPTTSFRYVEASRKAAFRVQYEMNRNGEKTLLITSVSENEGKSTVAANLALALADNGKTVLLIDLDLRKPSLHKVFDMPKEAKYMQAVLNRRETLAFEERGKLYLLLNDQEIENPSQYLRSEQVSELLRQVKEQVDFVILDSAPLSVAADTEFLTEYADASILVVRQDWIAAADINEAADRLQKSHSGFTGYILNDFAGNNPLKDRRYQYGDRKYKTGTAPRRTEM